MVLPSGGPYPQASRKACKRTSNDHHRGPVVAQQAVVARVAGSQDRPGNPPAAQAGSSQGNRPRSVLRIPALEASYVDGHFECADSSHLPRSSDILRLMRVVQTVVL